MLTVHSSTEPTYMPALRRRGGIERNIRLTICKLDNFDYFWSSADLFSNQTFPNAYIKNTTRMSDNLDPEQARRLVCLVGPVLVQIVC